MVSIHIKQPLLTTTYISMIIHIFIFLLPLLAGCLVIIFASYSPANFVVARLKTKTKIRMKSKAKERKHLHPVHTQEGLKLMVWVFPRGQNDPLFPEQVLLVFPEHVLVFPEQVPLWWKLCDNMALERFKKAHKSK
jgi:hypothetical protein